MVAQGLGGFEIGTGAHPEQLEPERHVQSSRGGCSPRRRADRAWATFGGTSSDNGFTSLTGAFGNVLLAVPLRSVVSRVLLPWLAPPINPPTSSRAWPRLPPYVLAAVDELKSRLRAEGHDVFDFGLGNPDGPSPKAGHRAPRRPRRSAPGNQRYMPSKRHARGPRARSATGTSAATARRSIPRREAVVTIGAKEGLAHLLLAIVGPGDCVLSPDPCYPIHRFGVIIAGGEPVPVATRPRQGSLTPRSRRRSRARRASPRASSSTSRTTRPAPSSTSRSSRRSCALAKRENALGDLRSRLRRPGARRAARAQHLPGAGRARRRRRVLHRVEELLDAGLARRLLRRQPHARRRAGDDQGLPRLRHVRADAAGGRDGAVAGVRRRRRREPRALQAPRGAARRRPRRRRLAGAAMPDRVDVRLGAAAGARTPAAAPSSSRPRCWRRRASPSRPASASARAARATSASRWSSPTSAPRRPAPRSAPFSAPPEVAHGPSAPPSGSGKSRATEIK